MTHELVLLAALFKPHMNCVWREPGKPVYHFSSDNSWTAENLMLYQRNYAPGFDEVIAYAYDRNLRRYVRTQLSNDGYHDAATSKGAVNGTWTFIDVPERGKKQGAISWKRNRDVSRYWYDGVAGSGECR
jgi:hypothetical protein